MQASTKSCDSVHNSEGVRGLARSSHKQGPQDPKTLKCFFIVRALGRLTPALSVPNAAGSLADRKKAVPGSKSYWMVNAVDQCSHKLLCWALA